MGMRERERETETETEREREGYSNGLLRAVYFIRDNKLINLPC